jgi:Uma2 family endonuclease
MAMPAARHFTAADLATMPDDGLRYEVVRGELLVTPAPIPPHQKLVTRLMLLLGRYLEAHGMADQLRTSPADLTLGPDTLVQPDLLVADTALADRTRSWTDVTTLFLVIEVISPSTARADRTLKRHVYQSHGVPQYWIVDGEQHLVEIWTPDPTEPVTLRDRLVWRHPSLDTDCVIDLRGLFDFG